MSKSCVFFCELFAKMSTVSVSKGVFLFKNGFQAKKKRAKKRSQIATKSKFSHELWYESFKTMWTHIEERIQKLNSEIFSNVLSSLVTFVKSSYEKSMTEIPTATLLTGINMPDHGIQFTTLATEIKKDISPHVVTLHAQDCSNIKSLVENMVNQFINGDCNENSDEEDIDATQKKRIKKAQCSFALLQSWYESYEYGTDRKVLAVIIPDLESFNSAVLQHFIQIASNYLNILPFVLVFGIATSITALNKALPYHVSSKVNIHVFHSQPSTTYLNNVLENIIFDDECPFHLDGRLFTLFLDVFLFYDFSVTGFIQNFKFAMLEHFSRGNQFAVCTTKENREKVLNELQHEDLENIRRTCFSFRQLVENETAPNQIKLLEDDNFFRTELEQHLNRLSCHLNKFHALLKCLQILVEDLPKATLGKQIREFYARATSSNIATLPEFHEAMQLLGFQSKDELAVKLSRVIEVLMAITQQTTQNESFYHSLLRDLLHRLNELVNSTTEEDVDKSTRFEDNLDNMKVYDRKTLKQQLLLNSHQSNTVKSMNQYERARLNVITYLGKMFTEHLCPPKHFVFHELFFFGDISIQNHIIGSHRGAIHTSLNDPNSYLHCDCCKLPTDASILDSMPDICIAYKLHLEYGKMINLYDWLQAFLAVLDPISLDDEETSRDIDPKFQARFTQCVAELEYLGFVKSSKRKTDHVSRLTWGG